MTTPTDPPPAPDVCFVPRLRALPDLAELAQYLNGTFTAGTAAGDAGQLCLDDAADTELARLSCALMETDGATPPSTVPGVVARAVLMRAAALWRRRNSVNGFDGFDDLGTVPVRATDPDIERELDRYRAWTFA